MHAYKSTVVYVYDGIKSRDRMYYARSYVFGYKRGPQALDYRISPSGTF